MNNPQNNSPSTASAAGVPDKATTPLTPNYSAAEALSILHGSGEIVEIRCLHSVTGHPPALVTSSLEEAERFALERNADGYNVYHTVNPIIPTFSGRNAGDDDIARLRWIPYDVDPIRSDADGQPLKGKHSATDPEKAEARKVADAILAVYRGRNLNPTAATGTSCLFPQI
jgi:hypothetical protein